jgi:hypothetical protein
MNNRALERNKEKERERERERERDIPYIVYPAGAYTLVLRFVHIIGYFSSIYK